MLPAVIQGAISIECRSIDEHSLKYLAKSNHPETKACGCCERAFFALLHGNCTKTIAGHARIK